MEDEGNTEDRWEWSKAADKWLMNDDWGKILKWDSFLNLFKWMGSNEMHNKIKKSFWFP